MRRFLALAVCSLFAAGHVGPAVAATDPMPPAPATRAAAAPKATGASITTSSPSIVFGATATLSGTISPASATSLVVERLITGTWTPVATTTSAADGSWSTVVQPDSSSTYRVRAADSSAVSAEAVVSVAPRLTLESLAPGRTFVGARFQLRVQPAAYDGPVTFAIRYAGRVRGSLIARPVNGQISGLLPSPGLGRLPVAVTTAGTSSFAPGSLTFTSQASAPNIRQGANGPQVRALVHRLRQLNFHTPPAPVRYDARVGDAVLAFRKAHRMPRTKDVDQSVWRRLAVASPLQPRHRGPARHIEVDKSRQLLMMVRNGRVTGAIHVSTGATGNTPEGSWRIYQKGGSYLPKFVAFVGNFGIHGYVPVPVFPASHGCVREPVWAAGWTFRQTRIGDRVYVYR